MAHEVLTPSAHAPACQAVAIVLLPLSHPELGAIRISDSLFAVGRAEVPFAAYPPQIVGDLSRRHARVFCEGNAAYLADLDSKNGTRINGVALRRAIARLNHGDEVKFGNALAYRVQLEQRAAPAPSSAKIASLVLTPDNAAAGLQPIVITHFPFLVSKADEVFARYKDACAQQLNYLSRRHAHIFLKGGLPYLEDLGSTNGSFVGGRRLDEHAVALHDGDVLAFGGHHFVYRLGTQWQGAPPDPTLTRLGLAPAPGNAAAGAQEDRTTFVAAADSFLDIFCVDPSPLDEEIKVDDAAADGAPRAAEAGPGHGKIAAFVGELAGAFGGQSGAAMARARHWGPAALALLLVAAVLLASIGAPERRIRQLLASGDYANAAVQANASLARDPRNASLTTLDTEAQLKAKVPPWMASLQAHQFDRAAAIVSDMKQLGRHNGELAPLAAELDWIGNLERFVYARGGADASSGDPRDAARVKLYVRQWEDDNEAHQRAFSTIASYVPQFRDIYAQALSHVRKLALSAAQANHEAATPAQAAR
jgi:pSer/pThr/pTyr-binding forkhead associated (FHA) protein